MKNTLTAFFVGSLFIIGSESAVAQSFFDTSVPDNIIGFGARVGFNTSNQTKSGKNMNLNLDSWGTGFDAGVVFDINIRNFFSIQPGLFFESRSNNYSYVADAYQEYGHTRYTNFTIPILASFKFYPAENIQWSADFGPYIQLGLGGSDKGTNSLLPRPYEDGYFDNRKKNDFGLKIGTGLKYANHYYIGFHYQLGLCDVWKSHDGHHKAWTFTLGYDF